MTVVADQGVRDLVSSTGLDRTLFVEAGAGTGKTSNLVDRVVNLVLKGDVRLADIAAITFTEAAATELQDRIRVRFEQEAASTADPEVERRCRQAIADADLAAVSTLHGFAKRILSEQAVAAGLPPRVDILDEVSSQLAQEARWDRFVDRLYQDPANEELLTRATLLDIALEARYPGQPTMKDVAAALAQSWDRLGPVAQRTLGPTPPIDLTGFRRAVADLDDRVGTCLDPQDKLCLNLRDRLVAMDRIAALSDARRALRALVAVGPAGWRPGRGGSGRNWPHSVADAKAALQAVNDAAKAVTDTVANDVLQRLLTLIAGEVLDAAEVRRVEGRLEFHDLLVLARRLLRTSPEARRSLHGRYRRLLLDEFQDTDPIQIELAVLIASVVDGREPASWDQIPVEEGRLFFVGDPKQSIYRFRRADIGLFLAARDRFAPDGTCQRLTTNFRTVPPIVDWVNQVFARLMPDEKPGSQPRYEPLDAHRSAHPGTDHRPVLLGGPSTDGTTRRADDLRQAEAGDVARAIDHIRDHPERWPVGEGNGGWRPAELSDITILVPTRTSLPHLREALAARRIPYRLDTGTLVYSTQEVRDALDVLRAVDDPGDEVSLVAALRSPLYACTDRDLLTWHQAGGRWDLTSRAPDGIADDHPVAAAVDHLRSLWQERWWLGPSELLGRVLDERRAFLLAYGHERPTEVWRRLRFLVDQARAFEEAGGSSLRAFLQWAVLQGSDGARVHDPLLPETDDHAVRIMTVHGSKGLEFPITILSGMTTANRSTNRGFSLLWDDDGFPQLRYRSNVATELHNPRADIEAEMDVDEKLRLLYVACTRARDHLLIGCHHNPGQDSYAGRLWRTCQELDGWWQQPSDEEDPAPQPVQGELALAAAPPVDDAERWRAERERLLEPHRRSRFVSATTIAREAGVALPEDEHGDGATDGGVDAAGAVDLEGGPAPVTIARRGRAGTAIGRAVHATLQVVDLADPTDVDGQAARQAELEAVPEAAETVAAMVRSALDSPAVRAAVAARHHKEVYVAAPVGDRVVEGYVDLLVETPDGLVVIDYKTDTVRADADVDAKLATYELQGATYAVALEASTGLPVVDCRFVFCRPAGALERSVGDLDAAKDRVRRHLGG